MAGTLDQLNFEVLISDDQFKEKVQADLELAKQLNTEVSALLDLYAKMPKIKMPSHGTTSRTVVKDATDAAIAEERRATAIANREAAERRATKAATDAAAAEQRRAAAAQNRVAAEARAERAMAQATKAQLQLHDAISKSNRAAMKQSGLFGELKSMAMAYFSIRGGWQLVQSLIRITGEFELQRTALGSMIGDLSQARQIIAEIQELAVKSPFAFKELTSYTKQLAAFSVPTEELFETTKMLADVSAGLGVGMDRIILAYGQIRSAAFLRGQEVRQLTEAGIPILKELAKQFEEVEGRAVSAGEVFDKISARLVPFEMVEKVFKDMTSEGGKFYEMQEIQAETLRGKVMNLKDAFEMMMNEIGSANDDRLKGAVDNLRGMMQNWETWGTILKSLIVTLGLYKATILATMAVEKVVFAYNRIARWANLQSLLTGTVKKVNLLKVAMNTLGITSKMALGGIVAAVAGLVTILASAVINSGKLDRELKEIGASASEGVGSAVSDLERLANNLSKAIEGTQEYRDIISEINRKYEDYLPNQLKEADGYDAIASAAQRAEQAIRNKARADAEAEGLAAIEKSNRKRLSKYTENFTNSLLNSGLGLTKKMINDIKSSFDAILLEEGSSDNWKENFTSVIDNYLGKGAFDLRLIDLAKIDSYQADLILKNIQKYAKVRAKINYELAVFKNDLESAFDSNYSTKEERLGVEKIAQEFRDADVKLKALELTQEKYDEELRKLNITKLEKLAALYDSLNRPDTANQYREQAKALKGVQEGWRGVINETLKGLELTKNTSFGLWADEYTQSVGYVEDLVKRYQEIDKEMLMVESFDSDMAKNLEKNKKAIEAVAKALGIDIQAIIASKKKGGGGKSAEQIELETQINMVKKLKQSYEELREFLDDDQMRRILKALFPNAQDAWLENLDFDAVLLKMADELKKYDTKAAASLRDTVAKDSAKDLADLFEAFKKYKDAVDDWKAEDFNFYGGDEVGKILRDLEAEYKKIEDKRKKTLELLRKAEEGDAEAIALLRITLGEEVWKQYVTNGTAIF